MGSYFNHGRSCAIGAAIEAETGKNSTLTIADNKIWPELKFEIDGYLSLGVAIVFLNDDARWTREEIADWVDMVLP